MDEEVDYYAVLGVSPKADEAVIKAAYRVLAKRYHPDLMREREAQSASKFRLITEAYETLLDVDRREQYDEQRRRPYNSKGGSCRSDASKRSSLLPRNGSIFFTVLAVVVVSIIFVNVFDTVWMKLRSQGTTVQASRREMPQQTLQAEAARNELNYDAQGSNAIGPQRSSGKEMSTKSPANERADKRNEQRQIASGKGGERPAGVQADRPGGEKAKLEDRASRARVTPRVAIEGNAKSTTAYASTSEVVPRRSNCASPDGTEFSITNLNGVATVAYNGAPPVRARIDYQGLDMVKLSKIVPDDRIAIGLMKGERDTTLVIVTDSAGNSMRTMEASCFGVAY